MHALSGDQIRSFIAYLRSLADYMLADLKRENTELHRDACVALVEAEEHRRGIAA